MDWASVITAMTSVALRKESVDRNNFFQGLVGRGCCVALRKESVDRNRKHTQGPLHRGASLSARRAWIEMLYQLYDTYAKVCRSPQGERG